MFCPHCGKPMKGSDKSCKHCGQATLPTPKPQQPQVVSYQQPEQKKNRRTLGCGGAILVLIVIVVIIAIASSVSKKTTTTPVNQAQPSTQPASSMYTEIGVWRTDSFLGWSLYVANPTKASITNKCAEMKKRYVDDATVPRILHIDFFDTEAKTPNFTGPQGYYFPDDCEPYHVAAYFFNPNNGETRLDFLKQIPE